MEVANPVKEIKKAKGQKQEKKRQREGQEEETAKKATRRRIAKKAAAVRNFEGLSPVIWPLTVPIRYYRTPGG